MHEHALDGSAESRSGGTHPGDLGSAYWVVEANQASASPTIDELILGARSPARLEFI
jgi:hypothetical protein